MRLIDAEALEAKAYELKTDGRMDERELECVSQVIKAIPPSMVFGYRADDLMTLAELLRVEGLTAENVHRLVVDDIYFAMFLAKKHYEEEYKRHMKEIAEGMGAK